MRETSEWKMWKVEIVLKVLLCTSWISCVAAAADQNVTEDELNELDEGGRSPRCKTTKKPSR